jgi:hypothetical protein
MSPAPGFIRVIGSPNTYTPSLLQQASGSPQDEGYFPIIIRVILKFVLFVKTCPAFDGTCPAPDGFVDLKSKLTNLPDL